MRNGKMKRWEGAVTPSLKPAQSILKITASCNKRIKRVRPLIISSMKFLVLRAPFLGRLLESLHRSLATLSNPKNECLE
jgi:hypothetical protein